MACKRWFRLFVLFVLLLVLGGNAGAQGPGDRGADPQAALGSAFTYQGWLLDGDAPAEGRYDLRFILYDADGGGSQVGQTVAVEDVAVVDGRFTVLLDFGAGVFAGQARYLEVAVRPGESTGGYTTLSPRQSLTATPQAHYAARAPWSGLDGVPAGFADGVDADTLGDLACSDGELPKWDNAAEQWACAGDTNTTYSAGAGLTLAGTQFQADFAGSGSQDTVARSDHRHLGQTWTGSNNPLVIKGTFDSAPYWAPLVLNNPAGYGLYVQASRHGLRVESAVRDGVSVLSTGRYGVYVDSAGDVGVRVTSAHTHGLFVGSVNQTGVYVGSSKADGMVVHSAGSPSNRLPSTDHNGFEVQGAQGNGLYVGRADRYGVWVRSAHGEGVRVDSASLEGLGVGSAGRHGVVVGSAGARGVYVSSAGDEGVCVLSAGGDGVYVRSVGTPSSTYGTAWKNGFEVAGAENCGLYVGRADTNGVHVSSTGNHGVFIKSAASDGVYVASAGRYAGYFGGNVRVTGSLSKGGGSFQIDHPLDPENKTLSHSFVESPDMMNVYNGNVTTDGDGFAIVRLPDYFEALNQDYRYQLTVIGTFSQAIVAREIQDGQFVIQTDVPEVKVSWQVTGIRRDPYAEANRIVVEEEKPPEERGTYLHPEAYGVPEERGLAYKERLAHEAGEEGP
jgi:hypothetical protein